MVEKLPCIRKQARKTNLDDIRNIKGEENTCKVEQDIAMLA